MNLVRRFKSDLVQRAHDRAKQLGYSDDTLDAFIIGYVDELLALKEAILNKGREEALKVSLRCKYCGVVLPALQLARHDCKPNVSKPVIVERKEGKCRSKPESEERN